MREGKNQVNLTAQQCCLTYLSYSNLVLGLHLPEFLSETLYKCSDCKLRRRVEFEFAGHCYPMTTHAIHHHNTAVIDLMLKIYKLIHHKQITIVSHKERIFTSRASGMV